MRVRLKRHSPPPEPSQPRPARPPLRLVESEPADAPAPDAPDAPRTDRDGRRRQAPNDEQDRLFREDGPADVAVYTCECGFVFEAGVTTSVQCPNCGCGQAW